MENSSKFKFIKMSNELLLILISGFIFAEIASNYNLFESIIEFVKEYDRGELKGLFIFFVYISFGAGIFSLGRLMELEKTLTLCRTAENDLKERDKIYRSLFEHSADAVVISDGKKILEINKKGCEIFGLRKESAFNVSLMSIIPGKYIYELQEALKETFRNNNSFFEIRCTKPDGNVIDMEISLSPIDRKNEIIQIIARDVTNRNKTKRWEEESKERLKTILDNTLCGILLIEASTKKIVSANSVALRATDYSEKEILGKVCNELICQTEKKNGAVSSDQARNLSGSILLKLRGKPVPIISSIIPVSIGGNGYFVESFIDVSECKEEENELLKTKMRAEIVLR